jgi:hypothetical protein
MMLRPKTWLAAARAATRQINPYANKIALLGNSIMAQNLPVANAGQTFWTELTAFGAGLIAVPNAYNLVGGYKHLQYVSSGGTSGPVEPIWPAVVGGTVIDGSITWTAQARTDITAFGMGGWTFAQMLSGQRLDEVWMGGFGGRRSTYILKNLPAALAANPEIVYFASMFENDMQDTTPAVILANWNNFTAQADYVRSLGKRVMLDTLLPNGGLDASSAFTGYTAGAKTKAWNWLNDRIKEYARNRPDVILFDASSVFTDPNPNNPVWPENAITYLSETGTGQQLKKTDGIHPYVSGAYLIGKALAAVLREQFPAANRFHRAKDTYELATNPDNGGTGGNLGAGVTSGQVPSLMTMTVYGSASSAVASIVPRTDTSGNFAQCAIVGTAGPTLDYMRNGSIPTAGSWYSVGSVVQAFGEIKILANPTLLKQVELWVRTENAAASHWRGVTTLGSTQQDWGQMITEDTMFTMKTLPFAVPPGTTLIYPALRVLSRGASSFTAQLGRMSLQPYPIPDIS